MNDKKVAFIICCNNDIFISECKLYIDRLIVPEGFSVDFVVIRGAKSMLEGMESGRLQTDAKYKVYMHQDVFILNRNFIGDIVEIFESGNNIGLIGMVGANRFPADGMWFDDVRVGGIYVSGNKNVDYENYKYELEDGGWYVDIVDGLLMATCDDVALRTDLFDKWHFYDVSTSLEYRRAGYKVFVPWQKVPWVMHDDGEVLSLWDYDKYRQIALEEYQDFVCEIDPYKEELERVIAKLGIYFKDHDLDSIFKELSSDEGQLVVKNNTKIREFYKLTRIAYWEREAGGNTILDGITNIDDAVIKARDISMFIYRVYAENYDDYTFEMFEHLNDNKISAYAYVIFTEYLSINREQTLIKIASMYEAMEEKLMAIKILSVGMKFFSDNKSIPLKLANMYLDMGMLNEAKTIIDNSKLKDDINSSEGDSISE